jgi:hypothetical protein
MSKYPPGFRAATRLFTGFHDYDPRDVGKLNASLIIPEAVFYAGPCTYVTYRSNKWNDGTHDYIHKIESYPRVSLGFVDEDTGRTRRVPSRISNNATLVQIQTRAIGFGYRKLDGEEQHAEVSGCQWFWHPVGKALLLIRNKRKLVAIAWGGKLDFKPQGLVG